MKNLTTLFLLFLGVISHAQTSYFVDDVIGRNQHINSTKALPFKSIARINQLFLKPGDSVLFRRSGNRTGNLVPKGSVAKNTPIVIGAYSNGVSPILDAKGIITVNEKVSHTIQLYNQDYREIRDINGDMNTKPVGWYKEIEEYNNTSI